MATFESRIHALRVEPHTNADRLELAAVRWPRATR